MINQSLYKTNILAILIGLITHTTATADSLDREIAEADPLNSQYMETGYKPVSKTVLGYKINMCQSYESSRNICNEKDIGQVIALAKDIKDPNFAGDKKLVQFHYKTKLKYYDEKTTKYTSVDWNVADILVIDEKKKQIYLSPSYVYFSADPFKKAPTIKTLKNSNWYCVDANGADFKFIMTPEKAGQNGLNNGYAFQSSSPQDSSWACNGFYRGQFIDYDNQIAPKLSSFAWLDKNGLREWKPANYD